MNTKLKVGMTVAGAAVIAGAIASAAVLNHMPLVKWALVAVGFLMMMPLWTLFSGVTPSAPKKAEPDLFSKNLNYVPDDVNHDNLWRPIGGDRSGFDDHL
ncbi:hypothetical protein BSFA1_79650 (plasmid) [Burkholderia sp. SFA1]|uniref:Uncharacterized protein n=1 Tax=Burkholderia vietnamiensis (strain G4 / LMG 22486) TaxID=269482 RepID=A4JTY9_BURVG|nr:hypothetical protein Bcep1808_6855 [Burkholderia vietnamiensis G4]AET95234.1 hypothetical protein BYI23_E000730 [Burkholderia sp. YI23]MCB4350101.1 hypothetical protein [Burkholderia vietnamiensis]BBQ02837.1 hypothetical protein BSFA1_79650 [Burkholderia sp. SFA1]